MTQKTFQPADVFRLLESPTANDLAEMHTYFQQTGHLHPKHGFLINRQIQRHTSVRTLILCLQHCTDVRACRILCDLLGERHARSAIPVLLTILNHPDSIVRYAAADALAKIRHPATGPTLALALAREADTDVQAMLICALGAVAYRPVIPALIAALSAPEPYLRGSAAWSLGELHADEAARAIRNALEHETDEYAKQRMKHALTQLKSAYRE